MAAKSTMASPSVSRKRTCSATSRERREKENSSRERQRREDANWDTILLRFPTEIWAMIQDQIVVKESFTNMGRLYLPGLLGVCRQLRKDCATAFHENNNFIFNKSPKPFLDVLDHVSGHNKMIQNMYVWMRERQSRSLEAAQLWSVSTEAYGKLNIGTIMMASYQQYSTSAPVRASFVDSEASIDVYNSITHGPVPPPGDHVKLKRSLRRDQNLLIKDASTIFRKYPRDPTNGQTHGMDPNRSALLRLPREIRDLIIEYTVLKRIETLTDFCGFSPPPFLWTCQQLRQETSEIWYARSTFVLYGGSEEFFQRLFLAGHPHTDLVKELRVVHNGCVLKSEVMKAAEKLSRETGLEAKAVWYSASNERSNNYASVFVNAFGETEGYDW